MTQKMASSIIIIAVIIAVFVIIAGVLPWMYNSNVEHASTHADYCKSLAAQIASDKSNHLNPTILTNEIQLYNKSCSG